LAFKFACQMSELPVGGVLRSPLGPGIALFNVDGEVFAVQEMCSHAGVSLADGYVEGDAVECVAHLASFSLRTGQPLCPPATVPLQTFAVKVVDEDVYVDVP